jgi:O-antigen biosynthesis protein WbqP
MFNGCFRGWLPNYFAQARLGKDKKIFKIYKIRTMKKNAPQTGTHNLSSSYHLNTGKVIRALKLDEFPQLINILKGDIDLVGPRPGLPEQNELTKARMKRNIFNNKPGITGLAQICGYDMSNPERLSQIDELYFQNQSYKLDSLILLGTFFKVARNYIQKELKI